MYVTGAVLLEIAVIGVLEHLGADSETVFLAYVVLLSAAGLGVGGIITHYSR